MEFIAAKVDPKKLTISPFNIRTKDVKGYDWEGFKDAIRATDGPVHRPIINKKNEVLVGQRRVLASQELGIPLVRVDILDVDIPEEECIKLSYLENRGRRNISSEEEEEAVKKLLKKFGTNDKVARFLGIDPSMISLILSRAGLPEPVKTVTQTYGLQRKSVTERIITSPAYEKKPEREKVKAVEAAAVLPITVLKTIEQDAKAGLKVDLAERAEELKEEDYINFTVSMLESLYKWLIAFCQKKGKDKNWAINYFVRKAKEEG